MWVVEKIVSKGQYYYAVVTNHPSAISHGYVLLHRIIMENSIGRLLVENEVVHHKNGNKKDNDISNLELKTIKQHVSEHNLRRGQLYVELICPVCKKHFEVPKRQSFLQKNYKYTCCSKRCRGTLSRFIQLHGLTPDIILAIQSNFVREFRKLNVGV